MSKIWTNSGDSHFLEPDDLWKSRLPKRLAELTPRAEKEPDGEFETVHVDGQSFRRKLPTSPAVEFLEESRKAQGIRDADRHPDLKVLISEGGTTWIPFLGDRMADGYRQHPHMEGTHGHTQETLKDLFAGVSNETGLFPHVPSVPADVV